MNQTVRLDSMHAGAAGSEARSFDLSIPLEFNGPQPNVYRVERASSLACAAGELVGDTRRGGSCNFEKCTFIPHCNGTHTECVGHITHERISVRDCLRDVFVRSLLISVFPEPAADSGDTYPVAFGPEDRLITRAALEPAVDSNKIASSAGDALQALIVRTMPNDSSKTTRTYDDAAPYFSIEAMQYIVDLGIDHLLVDLPSIDRLHDEGKLSNHRIFWNVDPGSFVATSDTRIHSTITELIYVPAGANDGEYMLNIQIAPFAADAAPSRPVIFRIG